MMGMPAKDRIIVALDTTDLDQAAGHVRALGGLVGGFKIGKAFFTGHGPNGIRRVIADAPLFLDLKFHDIPNTVAGAVRAATALSPLLLTVHAGGGRAMMSAAAAAAREAQASGDPRPKILGVTVLTSLDDRDLEDVGQRGPIAEQVIRLSALARESGLDGVVCSPREIASLRHRLGRDFLLVVPGIRPAGASKADQKRTLSPGEALDAGADYLVIGRPITEAEDPAAAARQIVAEMEALEAPLP